MSPMPTDTTEKEMESSIVRNLHPISSIILDRFLSYQARAFSDPFSEAPSTP
jgi:hypothetical protein